MVRLSTLALLGTKVLGSDVKSCDSLDEASMLQMPVVQKTLHADEATAECRCPGYFQDMCEAERAQGCVWSSAGSSNGPWCQCGTPVIGLPAPAPVPPPFVPPVTLPPVTAAPEPPTPVAPALSACGQGEGWTLVRHAAPGNQWHGATDRLGGIDVYGDPAGGPLSAAEWSIAFNVDHVSEFLFATGDCENWLIASKDAVIGEYYADEPRQIMQSSTSSEPYVARWYNRDAIADGYPHDEDPWISLGDHAASVADGSIVYGENHFGHSHAELVLPLHNGANVFIKLSTVSQ